MRLSCNGCRVLRKGCSENCSIRPCLEWIKGSESQANATVFLAKFYGRAGLMNLINAGPNHLRPAIFKSLLYEACGRIINPIYGSVGLMWSGSWHLCQDAVEAVLKGAPITQIPSDAAEAKKGPPLKAFDIRHVSVTNNNKEDNLSGSNDIHRVRTRCRFKRTASSKSKRTRVRVEDQDQDQMSGNHDRSPSHESSLSHQSVPPAAVEGLQNDESLGSANLNSNHDHGQVHDEIELDLTLGFEPIKPGVKPTKKVDGCCRMELGLHYPVQGLTISFDASHQ